MNRKSMYKYDFNFPYIFAEKRTLPIPHAYLNFLRHFSRLNPQYSFRSVLREAAPVWRVMKPSEKELYQEDRLLKYRKGKGLHDTSSRMENCDMECPSMEGMHSQRTQRHYLRGSQACNEDQCQQEGNLNNLWPADWQDASNNVPEFDDEWLTMDTESYKRRRRQRREHRRLKRTLRNKRRRSFRKTSSVSQVMAGHDETLHPQEQYENNLLSSEQAPDMKDDYGWLLVDVENLMRSRLNHSNLLSLLNVSFRYKHI